MTKEDLSVIADVIVDSIKTATAPLHQRIEALEADNAEQKQYLANQKYLGTWQSHVEYQVGNSVTHNGSRWHCNVKSTGCRPGDGAMWTCEVKGTR